MIKELNPYAEYKESGLPWAPRVPAHWNLIPNRAVLRKRKVLVGGNHKNYQLLSLTKGGIIVRDISTGKGKFSSDMGTSQEVRKGDFVFCLFDVPETPRTIGLSVHDGMITGAYTVFESQKLPIEGVRYLECFYIAMDDQKLLSPLYSGLRNTITSSRFLGTKTPQPPADEQAAIVRFLDHANKKIDGLIRTKRKLIGLLNEQKQAVIHRAVTRGLNLDVPLKPSGIPWLGDIPTHWEVLRAKYVFREMDERSKTGSEEQLSVSHITGVTPRSQKNITMFKAESYVGHKICRPGDLAVNTMWAWMAALGISKDEGIISPAYAVYRQRKPERLLSDFADHLLRISPYKLNYLSRSTGLRPSRLRLYPDEFFKIQIIIPPKDEQQQIVDTIAVQTDVLSTAVARTEREIALMQEYRTRLTSDIVTGKLDVREAAAKLPDLPTDSAVDALIDNGFDDADFEDVVA
ncbi:restriction endonuclease subunit S [Pseudomonas fluorescens]|uniref:restriction endonuclease subunit S n=1 Tax=Pseudomonas fluorescens TaxID=294 RepID=UPI00069C5316|nr:restriction endonuclease subunit S [Pseudomonas fluorescens]